MVIPPLFVLVILILNLLIILNLLFMVIPPLFVLVILILLFMVILTLRSLVFLNLLFMVILTLRSLIFLAVNGFRDLHHSLVDVLGPALLCPRALIHGLLGELGGEEGADRIQDGRDIQLVPGVDVL